MRYNDLTPSQWFCRHCGTYNAIECAQCDDCGHETPQAEIDESLDADCVPNIAPHELPAMLQVPARVLNCVVE